MCLLFGLRHARLIFTADQVRLVRQGKMSAVLIAVAEQSTRRLQVLRRRVEVRDGDGKMTRRVEVVHESVDGEQQPLRLSVMSATQKWLTDVTLHDARDCGFRTRKEVVDDWRGRHPRMSEVVVVRFVVGDIRDAPRLLRASMARGNYTNSPRLAASEEPEALSAEQLAGLTSTANQKDVARRHEQSRAMAAQSVAERLAAIEAAGKRMRVDVRRELHVITERVERAEKRLAS